MTVRQQILRALALQFEVAAHEADRLSTFANPDTIKPDDMMRELNKLVGMVTAAFEQGGLPEDLHTASEIYKARREFLRQIVEFKE